MGWMIVSLDYWKRIWWICRRKYWLLKIGSIRCWWRKVRRSIVLFVKLGS